MTIYDIAAFTNKRCRVIVAGDVTHPYYGNVTIWDDGGLIRIDPTTDAPSDVRTGHVYVGDITSIDLL